MGEQPRPERTREIFEANACCKTGARPKASKEFGRANAGLSMEDKPAKLREAPRMNMGSPVLDENGDLVVNAVSFFVDGSFRCACPSVGDQPLRPDTKEHCYCCAGHFRFHYESMLGCRLKTGQIVSSPLDSDGKDPCVVRFSVVR